MAVGTTPARPTRVFTRTWSTLARANQVLNMLTLSPAEVTSSTRSRTACHGMPSYTTCATSYARSTASSTTITMPTAPRLTNDSGEIGIAPVDSPEGAVCRHQPGYRCERYESTRAVGEVIEGVAAPDGSDDPAVTHDPAQLLDVPRLLDRTRVDDIACPVSLDPRLGVPHDVSSQPAAGMPRSIIARARRSLRPACASLPGTHPPRDQPPNMPRSTCSSEARSTRR